VQVAYTGVIDVTVETFARCRIEVREYLKPYFNWPQGKAFVAARTGCSTITTKSDKFTKVSSRCPFTL